MCLRKLFPNWFNPEEEPIPDPEPVFKKTALLFAINDYKGTVNDLRGCLNDQRDIANKLNELWPDEFNIKKFSDSQATVGCYKTEVSKAIAQLSTGAVVIVIADSCFSGTITRGYNPHPMKNRFLPNPDLPVRKKVRKRFAKSNGSSVQWLTLAMCRDNQTSADVYIDGEYHGAGTYYTFLKALKKGMTYREWEKEIQKYLPSYNMGFDQAPYLEGIDSLANRVVGDGEVLIIANSSHGTQEYDIHGDEDDGYDELICLYDGNISDDEINELLQKIPV